MSATVLFKREKYSSLDGRTKIKWTQTGSEFQLEATPSGVSFRGQMAGEFQTVEDFELLAMMIADLMSNYKRLGARLLDTSGVELTP